ncbi:hypothetical protein ACUUL3_09585 [Thiovibrio sp. JS02]
MAGQEILHTLWQGLGWPLARLVFFMSLGLLLANFIEALNWTHGVARLASPLIRLGNLSDICGASFSVSFFSSVSGNAMLGEAYEQGKIGKRELVLANLFNSLPTYFLHLPTLFFITASLLKEVAFVYVGLTLAAAFLRTLFVLGLGRILLPPREEGCVTCRLSEKKARGWQEALLGAWQRFQARIRRIVLFTVPIYILFFLLQRYGLFSSLESFIAEHLAFLAWLKPESLSIVVFHIAAEFTAGLAAAGALLAAGTLPEQEVVLALLAGNILSSPVRGVRHQFPFYAGIFTPGLATQLIVYNQIFRAVSLILVAVVYSLL